jgi:hypothetical protein
MLKLYKDTPEGLLYWETWEHGGTHTIHWGRVGSIGENKDLPSSLLKNAKRAIQKEIQARRDEGYAERKNLHGLLIQYRLDNWGNTTDLDRRHKIEDLMNECLGWTGLGHCDGGDIGSGTINIFCFVVDPYAAIVPIVANLRKHGELAGATIALEREDSFEVLYPEDFRGELKYWYE